MHVISRRPHRRSSLPSATIVHSGPAASQFIRGWPGHRCHSRCSKQTKSRGGLYMRRWSFVRRSSGVFQVRWLKWLVSKWTVCMRPLRQVWITWMPRPLAKPASQLLLQGRPTSENQPGSEAQCLRCLLPDACEVRCLRTARPAVLSGITLTNRLGAAVCRYRPPGRLMTVSRLA